MARQTVQNGQKVWTITAEDGLTRASFVPEFGGLGSSITMPDRGAAREVLFLHDFFWDPIYSKTRGGWPFLFPVCGRLERDGVEGAYLHRGQVRRLPIHGFSLRVPWQVTEADAADVLTMVLEDDETTGDAYPFAFRVRLTYRVAPGELRAEMTIENRGDLEMPYYAGFHPYFLTPAPDDGKERATIEVPSRRTWLYNERLTDIRGTAGPVRYPRGLGEAEVKEVLNEVDGDRPSRLTLPDGYTLSLNVAEASHPGLFPFVQLYTMPDKPFYCIEPWMGHPNSLNTVYGSRRLPPGGRDRAVLRLAAERA